MSQEQEHEGGDWIATSWNLRSEFHDTQDSPMVSIIRMRSPFYEGERYTVRRLGRCLNKKGRWEWEPIPSSRTDDFYKRCRFPSFEEAVAAYEKSTAGNAVALKW